MGRRGRGLAFQEPDSLTIFLPLRLVSWYLRRSVYYWMSANRESVRERTLAHRINKQTQIIGLHWATKSLAHFYELLLLQFSWTQGTEYFLLMYFRTVLCTTVYLNRLSNRIQIHKTWPTFLNYSTIVFYGICLDCSKLDCSVLECIVHGWGTYYQPASIKTILGPHLCTLLWVYLT